MKHKVKVVMLPTKYETPIRKYHNRLVYHETPLKVSNTKNAIFQHIYITVSQDVEPIKEGDWYIDDAKVLRKSITNEEYYWGSRQNYVKIIATTDPKLIIQEKNQCDGCNANLPLEDGIHKDKQTFGISCTKHIYNKQIPQLQQSFLEEFVDNPDVEYEVEYSTFPIGPNGNVIGTNSDYPYNGLISNFTIKYKLKLTQNNTIFINSVEENVVKLKNTNKELHEWYTCLDENTFEFGHTAHDVQIVASELIDKLVNKIKKLKEYQQFKITNQNKMYKSEIKALNKWIKENL
tara:strand:+ start:48 stop:920 length:873 start_codon:yes stop_codon:yes gene_type:complete